MSHSDRLGINSASKFMPIEVRLECLLLFSSLKKITLSKTEKLKGNHFEQSSSLFQTLDKGLSSSYLEHFRIFKYVQEQSTIKRILRKENEQATNLIFPSSS